MSNRPLKLAFIGGGIDSAVGRVHVIASQMDNKFELVSGCFSQNQDINRKSADEYGIEISRLYNEPEDLIKAEKGEIDAIVILTPTPSHKKIILLALENKIPVVSEKALVASSDDAKQISDCVNKTDGFLVVTYNYSGYPMIRELKSMIAGGLLGNRINQIHIEMPQEGFLKVNSEGRHNIPQSWRLEDGSIPTVSLDLGIHLVHMVQFLTSELPLEVIASEDTFGYFKGVIDNVTGIIRYNNNLLCTMSYGKSSLGYRNGLRVRVSGNEGAAEWYQMEPEFLITYNKHGTKTILDRGQEKLMEASSKRYDRFKIGHPAGFIEAFSNYYYDIADELNNFREKRNSSNPFISGVEDSYSGLKLLEAIHSSSISKAWQKVGEICLT